ncbi:MAG: gephyrin-like molybdotransferase Glp [Pirellulales bacterium]
MLTVAEALEQILANAAPRAPTRVAVANALGLVLAEDVASDIDSPPFDKTIVDGYAVQAADLAGGFARLDVLEQVTAGNTPSLTVTAGKATRIMTGTPLPAGCDAVVMVERTELDGDTVTIRDTPRPGQNILRQGAAMRRGDTVLARGQTLQAAQIGLLCEVGRLEVEAIPRPTVAILPTGDEVIDAGQRPRGGQIRNTNGPMLIAAASLAGGVPQDLGVGRDNLAELRRLVAKGLQADVLVLSGGVSAGVLDLVPQALAEEGVYQVFHKVRFKPGKPLWFGVFAGGRGNTLVFGLPGNPVSSLVCFEMFVRPAIGRLAGRNDASLLAEQGELTERFVHRGDRPTYHPARIRRTAGKTFVEPLAWQGSADLRGMANANGLVHFPAGDREFSPGDVLEVLWFAPLTS